jgi:hypothetical protein
MKFQLKLPTQILQAWKVQTFLQLGSRPFTNKLLTSQEIIIILLDRALYLKNLSIQQRHQINTNQIVLSPSSKIKSTTKSKPT